MSDDNAQEIGVPDLLQKIGMLTIELDFARQQIFELRAAGAAQGADNPPAPAANRGTQ